MDDGDEWDEFPLWMTTVELSKLIQLSKRTLEDYRNDGIGPAYVRTGLGKNGKVMYRRYDVVAWLKTRVVMPKPKSE